jgi:hypothetical protein
MSARSVISAVHLQRHGSGRSVPNNQKDVAAIPHLGDQGGKEDETCFMFTTQIVEHCDLRSAERVGCASCR